MQGGFIKFPASSEYGGVAQLGERTVRIRKVVGSIPIRSTKKGKAPQRGAFPFL